MLEFLVFSFMAMWLASYEWSIHSGRLKWTPRDRRRKSPRTAVEAGLAVRTIWRTEPKLVWICLGCLIWCVTVSILAAWLLS